MSTVHYPMKMNFFHSTGIILFLLLFGVVTEQSSAEQFIPFQDVELQVMASRALKCRS